jgi:hypothetical protein
VAWDGTDDSGRRLPAGAYIISTAGQGRMLTARVVLTH